MKPIVSIIIPLYNEEACISTLLDRVLAAPMSAEKEIIVVDDGSKDRSAEAVETWIAAHPDVNIRLLRKPNGGKGSAYQFGLRHSTGDVVIIQDSDLECDPNDIEACILPIINGETHVVYGSRELGKTHAKTNFFFSLGGHLVTCATNLFYGSGLTDEPTCYKAVYGPLARALPIHGERFDFEPEITAKFLRLGFKIKEVPISYYPRTVAEGKKIKWFDGIEAVTTLLKYRFASLKTCRMQLLDAEKETPSKFGLSPFSQVMQVNTRIHIILWALILAAFVLRLLNAWPSFAEAETAFRRPDSFNYVDGAITLLRDGAFNYLNGTPITLTPPLYSLFLAGLMWLFGMNWIILALGGILVSTAVVPLVYLIGIRFTTRTWSLVAAGFIAFNVTAVGMAPLYLSDTFFMFLVALQLLSFARFCRSGHPLSFLLAIFVAALATLARPLNIVWLIPALFILFIKRGPDVRVKLKTALAALLIFGAVTMPWMLRNEVLGAGFKVSTVSGSTLRYHNIPTMLARQTGESAETIRQRFIAEDHAIFNADSRYATEAARDAHRAKEGFKYIKADPLGYARAHLRWETLYPDVSTFCENMQVTQTGRGTLDVLTREGVVAAIKHYFDGQMWVFYLLTPLLCFTLLVYAGCAVEVIRTLVRRRFFMFWVFLGCSYFYIFMPGPITMPRYQLPALILIAVFGVMGLRALFTLFRRGKKPPSNTEITASIDNYA